MQYKLEKLGTPCRNFMITNLIGFTDPKDGRVKVAMVSFTNYVSGSLYLVDPVENTSECYTLQCDNGSYAMYNDDNKGIVIGTCTQYGCVQYFDLNTRSFRGEPAAINGKGEYYIYNFIAPGDGYLYSGTYPGCQLLRYNIAEHKLEDLGRAHPNPKNLYSRSGLTKDGYIFLHCSRGESCYRAYSLADGTFVNASDLGYDDAALEEEANWHDPRWDDCKKEVQGISRGCNLPDGSLILIRGQDYLYLAGDSKEFVCRPIPGTPPATAILTVGASQDGKIWCASNFGMTVCSYDPATNEAVNYPPVSPRGGGQIYGVVEKNQKLYFTTYGDGYHIEFDPAKPWDAVNYVNPKQLAAEAPTCTRPHSRSYIGPDGCIWTGWYGEYGTYSGALSKIETETGKVTVYPTGDRGIVWIATDDKYVYYVTNGKGNGMVKADGPFKLAAVNTDGTEAYSVLLDKEIYPVFLMVNGDDLIVGASDGCYIYKKDTLAFVRKADLPSSECIVPYDGKLIAFCGKTAYAIDPTTYAAEVIGEADEECRTAVVSNGAVYFASGIELWKLSK